VPVVPSVPTGVAQLGRAPVSKTGGWGFKSLLPCDRQCTERTTWSTTRCRTEVGELTSDTDDRGQRTPVPQFLREVRSELRKVNWPSREQIVSYTVVVLVLTLVLTSFVWGADEVIRRIIINTLG